MYARVLNLTVQPGQMDQALKIIQDSVAPVLKQQPGFKNWLLLTDTHRNKILSVTLWETLADLTEGEMNEDYQIEAAKVLRLLAGPPMMEDYEVGLQV